MRVLAHCTGRTGIANHTQMGNARVHEFPALHLKSGFLVKAHGADLRIQVQMLYAFTVGVVEQKLQHRPADPHTAPAGEYRHAADVAAGAEPGYADDRALLIAGQDVDAVGIDLIPFQLRRNPLFGDENRFSHTLERAPIAQAIGEGNLKPALQRSVPPGP